MEAAFRKSLRKEKKQIAAFTYYQYIIEDLPTQSGARLRMNPSEVMGIFLLPSERNLDFANAISIIDTAFQKVKESGVPGALDSEKLSKLSFLRSLKKMITDSITSHDYKSKAEETFMNYARQRWANFRIFKVLPINAHPQSVQSGLDQKQF